MNVTVTKPVFDYLYNHMVEIHNKKIKIINFYAHDYDAYMNVLTLMKDYIEKMERLLGDIEIGHGDSKLPCIIFGSVFCLKNRKTSEKKLYRVLIPREELDVIDTPQNVQPILCHQSAAQRLLLKTCGDQIKMEENGEMNEYVVDQIYSTFDLSLKF